jgi:hypothetical protein
MGTRPPASTYLITWRAASTVSAYRPLPQNHVPWSSSCVAWIQYGITPGPRKLSSRRERMCRPSWRGMPFELVERSCGVPFSWMSRAKKDMPPQSPICVTSTDTAGRPANEIRRSSPGGHGPLWNSGAERLGRNPLTYGMLPPGTDHTLATMTVGELQCAP